LRDLREKDRQGGKLSQNGNADEQGKRPLIEPAKGDAAGQPCLAKARIEGAECGAPPVKLL
jgi:hypothetical protein